MTIFVMQKLINSEGNPFLNTIMYISVSPAERAEGEGAKGPESEGKRGGRWRRVWRPGVSAAIGRGLRQGPVQDEAQPQAHQQPDHRREQRATGHEAQLLRGGRGHRPCFPLTHRPSLLIISFPSGSNWHAHSSEPSSMPTQARLHRCRATHSTTRSDLSSSEISMLNGAEAKSCE